MPKKVKKLGAARQHESGLMLRNANLSRARPFAWAWDQRILLGYFNLQIGEEGIGKGNFTAWVAARITRGELPGDLLGKPSRVAFIGDEDAWDHIWVPRLHAAEADLKLVEYIESGPDRESFDVKNHADALRSYVKDKGVVLVYFDQLLDNLGYTDSWKDKEVRDTLAPLREVARTTNSAMLASMHPNKRQGSFRERISGTPAFNALSRSSLLIGSHPDEPGRVVVVRAKGNYSVEPRAFEFRIEGRDLKVKGRSISTSRITSQRESDLTRDDLLDSPPRGDRSKVGQARTRLAEIFSDGEVRKATEVLTTLASEGFDSRAVQQARNDIGLETWPDGFQGQHMWGYQRPVKGKARRRDSDA